MLPLALTHRQAFNLIDYCWWIFIIVWLIGALNAKRTVERWSSAAGLVYLFVSAVSWLLIVRSDILGGTLLIHHGSRPSLVAVIVCVTGLVITVWARVVLGRNWSGSITYKENHELVERGPYRFIRHPIYTGLLLMLLGLAMVRGTADAVVGLAIFIVVHIWKLRREEALMTRHFPDSYPGYRTRTKALLPFLY
jgi:protein-S-isoprenylcysteine O-methyltransferase Ste14